MSRMRHYGLAEVIHAPERPSWRCRGCGTPWPCAPAKADLIATTDLVGRVIYMGLHVGDLMSDQPTLDSEAVFDRLLGWARNS